MFFSQAVLEKASLEFNETKLEKERMLLNKDDLVLAFLSSHIMAYNFMIICVVLPSFNDL